MKMVDVKLAFIFYFTSSFVKAGESLQPIDNLNAQQEGEVIFTDQQVEGLNKIFKDLNSDAFDKINTQFENIADKFIEIYLPGGYGLIISTIFGSFDEIKQFSKVSQVEQIVSNSPYNKTLKSEISKLESNLLKIDLFEIKKLINIEFYPDFDSDLSQLINYAHEIKEIIDPTISEDSQSQVLDSS